MNAKGNLGRWIAAVVAVTAYMASMYLLPIQVIVGSFILAFIFAIKLMIDMFLVINKEVI